MPISEEEVRKVAKLARIHLTEEEIRKFAPQLESILSYIDILNEVKTDGVEVMSQVGGLHDVTRPDTTERLTDPEDLLAASPLPIENHQVKVPNIFDEA